MSEHICPECQKPITDDEALLCHFCGGSLRRGGRGFLGKLKYSSSKIVIGIIVALVILSFLLSMF